MNALIAVISFAILLLEGLFRSRFIAVELRLFPILTDVFLQPYKATSFGGKSSFSYLIWFSRSCAARAKNRIKHRVPITPAMNSLLQLSERDTGYVFTVTGEYPVNNLGRAATRLKKKMAEISDIKSSVTIEEWKPHDLRRTAASGMARCGVFQEVIERVQNRVSGKFAGVAGIYNRYEYEKEKREALEKWANRFRILKR